MPPARNSRSHTTDSGHTMSDTATSEPSVITADAVASPTSAVLGHGMAHRARSQSVLGRHWSPSGLVGAVGRASVGFGLAVGRSRSIRPTVRYDDLNSAALRPSFDVWRQRRTGEVGDVVGDVGEMTAPAYSDPTESRRGVPISGTTSRGPVDVLRRQRQRQRRERPTWTDQIIQRSSIGFVASTPRSAVPESPLPVDFVPSGDAKLDQLRLLIRQREDAAERPNTDLAIERPVDSRGSEARAASADRTVLRRTTAMEPTVSGVADGPGRLARAMRPESALAPSVPRARLGGPPAPASPRHQPPGTAAAPRSTASRRPAGRSSRRAAEPPSRLEQLRAALIEHGLLTDGPDGAGEPAAGSAGPAPRGGRPMPRGDSRPLAGTGADLQRTVSNEGSRPNTPGSQATSGSTPPAAPGVAPSQRPRVDLLSDSPQAAGSLDASTPATSGDRGRAVGAVALAERGTSTAPEESRPVTSPTPSSVPVASSPPRSPSVTSAPVTSSPAQQLRVQRLLRSGLAAESSFANEFETAHVDSPADQGRGVDVVVGAVPTNATIDRVATSPVPTLTTRPDLAAVGDRPTLARVDSSPAAFVRRVTLPRALSSTHRPAPQLPVPDVRTLPGTVRTPARVSAVRVGEAQSAKQTEAVGQGTTGTPLSSPASSLIAPAKASTLLDVVRRSTLADPRDAPISLQTSSPSIGRPSDAPADPRRARRRAAGTVARRTDEFARVDRATADRVTADRDPAQRADAGASDRSTAVDPVSREGAAHQTSTDGAPEAVRPIRPAERVAEQFMTALSETVRRRPAPLPTTYRPLADAIAGPRPVMLSTDDASRRALRSVGKVAATTGATIHLDRQAIPTARLDEVMAHELTHIAHPSPTPRFFDDLDDSPEERRAEQVARIMTRSPMAPSASIVAPSGSRSSVPRARSGVVRRAPAPAAPTAAAPAKPSPDTLNASALAARLTGGSPSPSGSRSSVSAGDRTETIQRSPSPSSGASTAPAIQRAVHEPSGGQGSSHEQAISKDQFVDLFRDNLSEIMNLIEDRMVIELERRGGRTWGAI